MVGPFVESNCSALEEIQALKANWISLSPEASLDGKTMTLKTSVEDRLWSNDLDGYKEIIDQAKTLGQKILLKPHIVVEKNRTSEDLLDAEVTWRGDIQPKFFWDWKTFDDAYHSYILEMARFAQAEEIDMFCIGTELKSFVETRPKFWFNLISEVRKIYQGQIIYSANWDNYDKIPFWRELDFIGVNGYFPISTDAIPSVEKVKKNWKSVKRNLQKFCEKYDMKIIITEFGYRNVEFSGVRPWTHNKDDIPSLSYETQSNLLNGYFQSLWDQDWIAGGFLWNWNYNSLLEGNTDFTVQDKPAIKLVKLFYSNSL